MRTIYTTTILALIVQLSVSAQDAKDLKTVKLDDLISETQVMSSDADSMDMVWWLPIDFWKTSFAQDPTASQADIDAISDVFMNYELFAVLKGKIGHFGGVTYEPLASVLSSIKINYKKSELLIVDINEVPADIKSFISLMRPMMANMMGPMGENMHFLIAKNGSNANAINPLKKEDFTFELGDFSGKIDLPLASLMREKKCPEDNKLHSGKWDYCPFHGEKLVQQ